jgi:hypothetical protein
MTAPAAMPTEEEIGKLLIEARSQKPLPADVWAAEAAHVREMEAKYPDYITSFSMGCDATRQARAILSFFAPILAEKEREIAWLKADRDNSNGLLDACRHERNVLQKICAERADAVDAAKAEIEKLRAHHDRVHKLRDAAFEQAHRANEDLIGWRDRALAAEAALAAERKRCLSAVRAYVQAPDNTPRSDDYMLGFAAGANYTAQRNAAAIRAQGE